MGRVFEDELLEIEKGAFVGDLLPHLDDGAPGIGRKGLGAVGTLVVGDDVFDFEGLLEDGVLEGFLLDSDLDLHTP